MNDGGPPPYVASEGDALRDRELMLGIWQGNLGAGDHMARKYDWFYRQCPYGPPLVQRLHHSPDGHWVGACSMGRRRMLWQGREVRSGVMVDLAVLPQHRSLGPALLLQQALVDAARRELDLALGFPNPKAAAVFKRIRYDRVGDIVRCVRVLRHGGYLRRWLPRRVAAPLGTLLDLHTRLLVLAGRLRARRMSTEWSSHAVDDMDALWRRSPHGGGLLAIRDAGFVRWRFDQSPLVETRHLLVREKAGSGLEAWFTTSRDGDVLHVLDFWALDAVDGLATRYIDALVSAAWKLGCSAISMEAATSEARMAPWTARGFVERGRRPVFARWSRAPDVATGDIDLHLTVADEDE